jgi:hypothetical protein
VKKTCSSRIVLKITIRQVAIPAALSVGVKGINAANAKEAAPAMRIVFIDVSLQTKGGRIYSSIRGSEMAPDRFPEPSQLRISNQVPIPELMIGEYLPPSMKPIIATRKNSAPATALGRTLLRIGFNAVHKGKNLIVFPS